MPSKIKDVEKFFQEFGELKAKVEGLIDYQKWQMGLLAAILVVVITRFFR
jgi:hypothetical protein